MRARFPGGVALPGDPDGMNALELAWVLAVPIVAGGRLLGVDAARGGDDVAGERGSVAVGRPYPAADVGTGGGGIISKCCPPPPLPTRVLIGTPERHSRQSAGSYDSSERLVRA